MVTCGARDCDGEPCNTGPTNAPSDFDCPSDGTFADPDNCIKYIQCSGDVAVEIVCPIGEHIQYWMIQDIITKKNYNTSHHVS